MTREELAVRLVVTRVLKEILAAADSEDRKAAAAWAPGDRLGAVLCGEVAGHTQVRNGAVKAAVTDPEAFKAWVSQNRPGEIEFLSSVRVRPAYQSAILTAAKRDGVAVSTDGEEIPGVTVTQGEPTLTVTLTEDASALVAKAWQSGELWEIVGSVLTALEPARGETS